MQEVDISISERGAGDLVTTETDGVEMSSMAELLLMLSLFLSYELNKNIKCTVS